MRTWEQPLRFPARAGGGRWPGGTDLARWRRWGALKGVGVNPAQTTSCYPESGRDPGGAGVRPLPGSPRRERPAPSMERRRPELGPAGLLVCACPLLRAAKAKAVGERRGRGRGAPGSPRPGRRSPAGPGRGRTRRERAPGRCSVWSSSKQACGPRARPWLGAAHRGAGSLPARTRSGLGRDRGLRGCGKVGAQWGRRSLSRRSGCSAPSAGTSGPTEGAEPSSPAGRTRDSPWVLPPPDRILSHPRCVERPGVPRG